MRKYGWKKDSPDPRDLKYSAVLKDVDRPQMVDLRPFCSRVEDQGDLGSCTANALACNLELLQIKDAHGHKDPYWDVSRIFIYYNERKLEGTVKEDSGATLRNGIKTLARQGYCSEELVPYEPSQFTKRPPFRAYWEARKHRITSYYRIEVLSEMLTCLASGYPFVFGFQVFESFQSEEVKKTGNVFLPKGSEESLGGHAVCAVGYNLMEKRFIVRNSWGTDWGRLGYFTMPFDYMLSDLASDFWTIRRCSCGD